MSLESLASGMNEMKSTCGDGGNTMRFDPDKRMDTNDNRTLFTDNHESGFDPDKRIDTNDKQRSFLNDTKNLHEEVKDDNICYYDDNGNLYRVDGDLKANNEYEINQYVYRTDGKGRIISAEGVLHPKNHEGRLPIKDSIEDIGKGSEKEGDDRGHLIGDQFDGSNGLENMIPQDAIINRNDFKCFENELAGEMNDEKEVNYKVEPVYDGDSRRPTAIVVTYSIDGEENVRVFPNGRENDL